MTTTSDSDWVSNHYQRQVKRAAAALRDVADRIEREGLDLRPGFGTEAAVHSHAAQRVVHAVMWGLANANLDAVVLAAAEADVSASTEPTVAS